MYDLLELDALPRQGNVLTARIHQHRYERRRARRHRIAGTIALIGLAVVSFVCWPQLQPLLAQLDPYQWVAVCAGVVFVVSTLRLVRRLRGRSTEADATAQAHGGAAPQQRDGSRA